MLPYQVGINLITKHKLTQPSKGAQDFYNGPCFKVTLVNENNIEEIIKALGEAHKQQKNKKKSMPIFYPTSCFIRSNY
jgi:hypothetical protein